MCNVRETTPDLLGRGIFFYIEHRAIHFGGLSSDHNTLLLPFVERMVVLMLPDSLQGSEHAIRNPSRWPVPGPQLCAISVRRKWASHIKSVDSTTSQQAYAYVWLDCMIAIDVPWIFARSQFRPKCRPCWRHLLSWVDVLNLLDRADFKFIPRRRNCSVHRNAHIALLTNRCWLIGFKKQHTCMLKLHGNHMCVCVCVSTINRNVCSHVSRIWTAVLRLYHAACYTLAVNECNCFRLSWIYECAQS